MLFCQIFSFFCFQGEISDVILMSNILFFLFSGGDDI